MTGSVALDVVIGLVFVYLLYSLLATILQELVASATDLRAEFFEKAIQRMLDDQTGNCGTAFSEKFYDTPLIKYMGRKGGKKPSYLASRNFSKAVLDILRGADVKPGDDFRLKIDESLSDGIQISEKVIITGGDTFRFFQSSWADAHGDIEKFRGSLEQWFDDTMERASGWYKRRTQIYLFVIGFIVAGLFNVDTIRIAGKLSNDPTLREQLVRQADAYVKAHPNLKADLDALKERNPSGDTLRKAQAAFDDHEKQMNVLVSKASEMVSNDIKDLNEILGLAWTSENWNDGGWFRGFFGWILTALAISLGAPFWFDLLNKLMKIRGAVPAGPDSGSADKGKNTASKNIIPKG